ALMSVSRSARIVVAPFKANFIIPSEVMRNKGKFSTRKSNRLAVNPNNQMVFKFVSESAKLQTVRVLPDVQHKKNNCPYAFCRRCLHDVSYPVGWRCCPTPNNGARQLSANGRRRSGS